MIIQLDRQSRIPLYIQIASEVRQMIASGALKPGDRLPANRELAKSLDVNRNTVTSAYSDLEADGLIKSHVGRGTFITDIGAERLKKPASERPHPSPMVWGSLFAISQRDNWLNGAIDTGTIEARHRKNTISFAYGLPSAELFPLEEFRRSIDRVLRREGHTLLQLGLSSGYAPLREYIVSQLAVAGISAGPDELLITNGCQQSLDLIRRVLVGPGDEIVIEDPTYPGAISVFCSNSARYVTAPTGENGIELDALEDILSQRKPKLIYTIPTHHNPTGARMDLSSRRRLIELAVKHHVPIVEDDIYGELDYEGPALPSLKALDTRGIVITINSFSKVGFPSMRVGWIVAPRAVIERLTIVKQTCDLHTSLLAQAAIYEFSRRGFLARHIRRVKKTYAERRDVMIAALGRYFPEEATWTKPTGGMAIWVKLPPALNTSELLAYAAEKGVLFSPGEYFYSNAPEKNRLRLCFTVAGQSAIEEGIKRLGGVITERLVGLRKQSRQRVEGGLRALV